MRPVLGGGDSPGFSPLPSSPATATVIPSEAGCTRGSGDASAIGQGRCCAAGMGLVCKEVRGLLGDGSDSESGRVFRRGVGTTVGCSSSTVLLLSGLELAVDGSCLADVHLSSAFAGPADPSAR